MMATQIASRSAADLERLLAEIWRSELGIDVGLDDDFYALGGSSLVAARIVARLHEATDIQIRAVEVLRKATVRRLAVAACEAADQPFPDELPSDEPAPLTFAQQRIWHIEQLIPGASFFTNLTRLELRGDIDIARLVVAVHAVARRHDILRTRFESAKRSVRQRVVPYVTFPLVELDLRGMAPAEQETTVADTAAAELGRGFDLSEGPPFRVTILHRGDDHVVVVLATHHIAFDGWSRTVLIGDLLDAYRTAADPYAVALPPLRMQYTEYARMQRARFGGDAFKRALDAWRAELSRPLPDLDLAVAGADDSYRTANVPIRLGVDDTSAARELARANGTTLFVTLLAALKAAVVARTGATEATVVTLVANRDCPGTQDMIGLFANTLVLRTDISGDPSFTGLVGRVRETVLRAFENQDVPFEAVLDELAQESTFDRGRLLRLGFALHGPLSSLTEIPGLDVLPLDTGNDAQAEVLNPSTFDLTIELREAGDDVAGFVQHKIDRLPRPLIESLVADMRCVLAEAVRDGDAPISSLLA